MERYTVTWEGELRQQQVIQALPPDPVDDQDEMIYWDRIMEADAAWRWETLEIDMGTVSRAFPGVLFRVEIEKVDEHTRHVQHHRDGQYYEAQEIRELPGFEPNRMVNTPPDPAMLDLDTPIVQVQVPTIRDVLTSFLEEAERDFVEIHTELAQPAGSRTALSVDQLLYAMPHLRRAASSMVLKIQRRRVHPAGNRREPHAGLHTPPEQQHRDPGDAGNRCHDGGRTGAAEGHPGSGCGLCGCGRNRRGPAGRRSRNSMTGTKEIAPGPCGNAEPWLRDFWGLSPLEVMKGKDREMLEQLEEDEKGALLR